MRSVLFPTLALALAPVLAVAPARADDTDLKDIVEKAVKAHGGAENLKKLSTHTGEDKGIFYGMGEGIPYTAKAYLQYPGKQRVEINAEIGGEKFEMIRVLNGKKGWVSVGGETMDMPEAELASDRENLLTSRYMMVTPLLGKGVKLSALGEDKVGGKAVVGIRAEAKGHRPVNLFFDKKTHLLVKMEGVVKDPMADADVTQTSAFSDFKKVDGLVMPHKVVISRDGKKYVESEITGVSFHDKFDKGLFAKP